MARSSLAFQWIKQYKKNTAEHYQVLQYCMDRSITADRKARWGQDCDGTCVPCMMLEGRRMQQTKEHLWSGECVATNDIMKEWVQTVETKLKKWNIEHMGEKIIEAVINRIGKVNLQRHSLENHGKGAILVGLWDNDLLQEIKMIAHGQGQVEEAAMQLAMTLMGTHMTAVLEVQRRWYQVVQVWETPLTQMEKRAGKRCKGKEIRKV